MTTFARNSNLPSIDTQMVDPVTGECTTSWFNFFLALFNRTGATSGVIIKGQDFLYPTTNGNSGQVLTSQADQPTIWTTPLTEAKLVTDGFVKLAAGQTVPSVAIGIGQEQGAVVFNKFLMFWGDFNVPLSVTTPVDGSPIEGPQIITVTVPGTGIKRLLDVSADAYRDPDINTAFQQASGNTRVFNYGYDETTGLYTGRPDSATNKFDVFASIGGIYRYRGYAELT